MPNIKLTDTVAKSLQADPDKHILYRDTTVPGLALRVTKNAHKTFVFNYSIAGRERRLRIGEFPGHWSVTAAREQAKDLRRKVDQGIDPLEELQMKASEPTIEKLWSVFEKEHMPNISKKYAADQAAYWKRYILPKLGKRKLNSIGSHEVDNLHRFVSDSAPVAANRVISSLRKALNFAKRRDWVTKNVAEGVRFNREESRQRYLTDEELKRMSSAIERMPNQQAANAVRLLLLTGARRSEVLGARWSEFDLINETWTKPANRVKTRRDTTIPLSALAVELLKKMAKTHTEDFLFPSRSGGPVSDIKSPWAWLMKETGLENFRIHDLRHSHASILVSQGHSLELIGRLLGHTQHQTTARYAHLTQNPLRKALAGLDATITESHSKPG